MSQDFVIFPQLEQWSVYRIDRDKVDSAMCPDVRGMAIRKREIGALKVTLDSLGFASQAIVLALPSELCLCAQVDASGLPARGRHTTLKFRFEEYLPVPLEEVVSDFTGNTERPLGVAVILTSVAPLLQLFQEAQLAVACVCPAALLCADQLLRDRPIPANRLSDRAEGADGFLTLFASSKSALDLVHVSNGQIICWNSLPKVASVVSAHWNHVSKEADGPVPLLTLGIPEQLQKEIQTSATPGEFETIMGDPKVWAARAGARVLAGTSAPPVNLRREGLADRDPLQRVRGPVFATIAAIFLLGASLAFAWQWRAREYEQRADQARVEQQAAFHQVFPNQAPPLSITSRLLSEQKRLEGLSGSESRLPPALSVLPVLRNTLAAMPNHIRFRILELRLEPQSLYLEGQTLDHAGADQIASALRSATGLRVDPPHTEQPTGGDVTFTVTASVDANAPQGQLQASLSSGNSSSTGAIP